MSRPVAVSPVDQEAFYLLARLSLANRPIGAPLLVMMEIYEAGPGVRYPTGIALSLSQMSTFVHGIRKLVQLASVATWREMSPDHVGPVVSEMVRAQRGMTDTEIQRFMATGQLPDLSKPPEEES
ncbi:hypothetical protein ABZ647_17695 [Micromonospora aurantiaca]|uniref:hypothetical protein n=1 Tax=Micromonospora aurantiaca (nom. illeg.) TaxID=47850 RepID=UPI0033FE9E95